MNKHLLTVPWLLSLMVVNQAFCVWNLTIKNETNIQQSGNVKWVENFCSPDKFSLAAGQTKSISAGTCQLRNVLLDSGELYIPKTRNRSLGLLTIKTGSDGKPFIVENQ